jgi:hypothetical protein
MVKSERLKNKLFKGLTEHDVLTWEEEKMRYQRRLGRKATDLEFLRYLLMAASRPVVSYKDGTQSSYLTGQGPIYEKAETLLSRYRSHSLAKEMASGTQQKPNPRDRIPE